MLKDNNIIIYANHISFLDPINLIFLARRNGKALNFMAKEELFKNPFFTWFLKKMGAFPVKRGEGAASLKRAAEILEEGKTFCIFPEGTRSKTGSLGATEIGHFLSHERASRAGAAGGNRHPGSENEGLSKNQNRGLRSRQL